MCPSTLNDDYDEQARDLPEVAMKCYNTASLLFYCFIVPLQKCGLDWLIKQPSSPVLDQESAVPSRWH
eukprot:scaffold15909_cov132-Skeletonema_marinoi.AAC.7